MQILFFTHYFPPEVNAPALRTYEHCREWARQGHEVHVVTCVPNHPQGKVYPGYKSRFSVQRENVDGIRVHRVWTYIAANKGIMKRTLGYMSFMISAPLRALQLPRPDVIIATSPQFFCACAGFIAGKIFGRPWIFELRDIWPESIVAVGAIRAKGVIKTLEKLELTLYGDASAVVALTSSFKRNLVSRGIGPDKIHVVTNGVNPEAWRPGNIERLQALPGLNGKFVVSYIGTHGMAHDLETALEAARILQERSDIGFLTAGDGAEFENLLTKKRKMGLDNFVMRGQVPHGTAKSYLLGSDASLVILRKSNLFKTVIPSKIFEAMAAGKPIILAVEGEAQRIVEETEAGICIEPENPQQLAEAVIKLREDTELRKRLGRNGRRAVEEEYNRKKLAERMMEVMREVGR